MIWLGDTALASGGVDGSVALWRAPSGGGSGGEPGAGGGAPKLLRREGGAHSLGVVSLSAGPAGVLLSTGLRCDTVLWAATVPFEGAGGASLARLRTWPLEPGTCWRSAHSPVSSSWAAGGEGGLLSLWAGAGVGAPDEPAHALVKTDLDFIASMAWSPDGRLVAAAGLDGSAAVVDAATGVVVAHIHRAHALPLCAVAWSHDGGLLYTCSRDRSVHTYDVGGLAAGAGVHSSPALSGTSAQCSTLPPRRPRIISPRLRLTAPSACGMCASASTCTPLRCTTARSPPLPGRRRVHTLRLCRPRALLQCTLPVLLLSAEDILVACLRICAFSTRQILHKGRRQRRLQAEVGSLMNRCHTRECARVR